MQHTDETFLLINNPEERPTENVTIGVYSTQTLLTITPIYVLLLLTGILGNTITCTVIARNKSMHTPTNYYLFSLAISDMLILLLHVPYQLNLMWNGVSGLTVSIVFVVAVETAPIASILTTTVFTVERYLAICHPFNIHARLSGVVKCVVGIWVVAGLLAALLAATKYVYYKALVENELDGILRYIPHVFAISTFLLFVIPVALIAILYVSIGLALKKRNRGISLGTNVSANDSRVIRMLVAVVVVFVICWAPFQTQRLLVAFNLLSSTQFVVLTIITSLSYYISTIINPVLYNLLSKRFRKAFKETFEEIRRKFSGCAKLSNPNSGQETSTSTLATEVTENPNRSVQKFSMISIPVQPTLNPH